MGKRNGAKQPKRRKMSQGAGLLAKANTTSWVLLAIVVGICSYLAADRFLSATGDGPFVNPYSDQQFQQRKSLLEDKRKQQLVPGKVVDDAMAKTRDAWERRAFDEAMGYIEDLESIGIVGGGVLNNKGVIAWDSGDLSLAFNIFCDAIEVGSAGVKKDALTNISNMWLESQFIFTDDEARARVGTDTFNMLRKGGRA